MRCPTDDRPLAPLATSEGPTVDFCDHCGGTWFEAAEFEAYAGTGRPLPLLDEGTEPKVGRPCPAGHGQMVEVSWPPHTALRVEVCGTCRGVWLDRGEVADLARASRSPSVHRAYRDDGMITVPIQPVQERPKLAWVGLAVVILLVAQAAGFGFFRGLELLDALADRDRVSPFQAQLSGAVLGSVTGGFIVGRFSPGFTIWEPAAAAVPALALYALIFRAQLDTAQLGLLLAVGFVLVLVSAVYGERRQDV